MKIMPDDLTLVDENHCGPICRTKKRVSKIGLGFKDWRQRQQVKSAKKDYAKGQKRASKLGMKFSEYAVAVSQAQAKGQQKAQKEKQTARYKEVEQQAYFKAGGKVGKPQSMFDQIMGGGSKPQASSTPRPKQRKVKPQFQMHGGKLYQVQQPKVKTKRKNLTKRTKQNGYKKAANFFGASNGSTKRSKKSNKDPFGINSTDWSFGL